jgi:hypothetical protein
MEWLLTVGVDNKIVVGDRRDERSNVAAHTHMVDVLTPAEDWSRRSCLPRD